MLRWFFLGMALFAGSSLWADGPVSDVPHLGTTPPSLLATMPSESFAFLMSNGWVHLSLLLVGVLMSLCFLASLGFILETVHKSSLLLALYTLAAASGLVLTAYPMGPEASPYLSLLPPLTLSLQHFVLVSCLGRNLPPPYPRYGYLLALGAAVPGMLLATLEGTTWQIMIHVLQTVLSAVFMILFFVTSLQEPFVTKYLAAAGLLIGLGLQTIAVFLQIDYYYQPAYPLAGFGHALIALATASLFGRDVWFEHQSLRDAFDDLAQKNLDIEEFVNELELDSTEKTVALMAQRDQLQLQQKSLQEQKLELEDVHQKLIQTDQQKSIFFRSISHEIRTPLTLIIGSLKHMPDSMKDHHSLQVVQRNSKRLLRLMNQLLDFQKLSQGHDFKLTPIDLPEFMSHVVQYFGAFCKEHGVNFSSRILDSHHGHPVRILGQIDALEKIVFNYLSNALKFTPINGHIRLILQVDGMHAVIRVEDSGPGISEEKKTVLFKVFAESEAFEKHDQEGTGLGLALVKELTHRMQGQVGVESQVGFGSKFWVSFPLSRDCLEIVDILYVDSDKNAATVFETQLRERIPSALARICHTIEEAIAIIQAQRVSCILVDMDFPEAGALELLHSTVRFQPDAKRFLLGNRGNSYASTLKSLDMTMMDRMAYKPLEQQIWAEIHHNLERLRTNENQTEIEVVVVDSDPVQLRALISTLHEEGYEKIQFATSLQEGRALIRSAQIRCFIAEAKLGEESGIDLLGVVHDLQPKARRILMTSDEGADILERAVNSGHIHHILYKPLQKEELVKVVEHAVRKGEVHHGDKSTTAKPYQPKEWLLADIVPPKRRQTLPAKIASARDARPTILVVDDVEDMRALIRIDLERQGFRVLEAEDGEEALKVARADIPDIIITDWMMPKLSGPELLDQCRHDPLLEGIPCILLTAKGDEASRLLAAKLGAVSYLSKPFDHMELISMTDNLLKLKEGEKRIAELNRNIKEHLLKRFFPPSLIEDIVQGHISIEQAPQTHAVTVIFADLCEFTKTSAELGASKIAVILNEYLSEMTEIIFAHEGTIDKFIGDAVMVIFGAPQAMEPAEQIRRATACALAMRHRLAELSVEWRQKQLPAFQLRIGIHHGPAVAGMFGSHKRSDFTVIGPTVNTAARVESAAEQGEILVTKIVMEFLEADSYERAGTFHLKGIRESLELFRLKDKKSSQAA